jgi:hypothetical protein
LDVVLTTPPPKTFLVTKPHVRYVRRQKFFKNCRDTEEEEEEKAKSRRIRWVRNVA